MTILELISLLNDVEDKSKRVCDFQLVFGKPTRMDVVGIAEGPKDVTFIVENSL